LAPTIHATAVLIGARAALIRGPAGSGKSRLAFAAIEAARSGLLPFARLVGDDRVHVEAAHGRLLVRPAETLAVAGLVIDLAAADAERLPAVGETTIAGIALPRRAVAPGEDALPILLAALHSADSGR
jgi:serine kinase of HPr protein (carbohydrate metabolism regulator)